MCTGPAGPAAPRRRRADRGAAAGGAGVRAGGSVRCHRHVVWRGRPRRPAEAAGCAEAFRPRVAGRQHGDRGRFDARHQQHHRLRRKRLGRAGGRPYRPDSAGGVGVVPGRPTLLAAGGDGAQLCHCAGAAVPT
ncbi:hypothetical protein G6F24_016460 [Rhizopus arrhizus]|nr:hypothetical protein G6F24_016460 [Rhizopus arrhizus]